jgi:predicted TIM-barrel fold metal-dependent hydrolase
MHIVDAQAHLWLADSPDRPWTAHGRTYAHGPSFTPSDLLREMDGAGVDRVVLMPPSWDGYRNDVVLAAARQWPDRFGAMGRIDAADPASVADMARWRDQGLLGYRLAFGRAADPSRLADGSHDAFWSRADELGAPVMVYPPGALRVVAAIAVRHPGVRLIIDHCALPVDTPVSQIGDTVTELAGLARFPNVAVKASALPCSATDGYPFRSTHDIVYRALDAFGAERVFWGSDLTRLPCPYAEAVRMFTEGMTRLSGAEQKWIMGEGIRAWLNWK